MSDRLLQDTDGNTVRTDQIAGPNGNLWTSQHQHQTRQPKYQSDLQPCQLHHRLTDCNSRQRANGPTPPPPNSTETTQGF
jgi:hypothetical protein